MAKMQRQTIRDELIARGFDGFSPDDLNRYINWGYFWLARKLRISGVETSVDFSLSTGGYWQATSALSSVPKAIRKVVGTADGHEVEIKPMSPREFWMSWAPFGFSEPGNTVPENQVGEPEWYFIYNDGLILMPAASESRTFVASIWFSVVAMDDDSDTYALPEDLEELLLMSIMRVCHTRANELNQATDLEGKVLRQVEDLITEDAFIEEELQDRVEADDDWLGGMG